MEVKVIPNSKKNSVIEISENKIKVKLTKKAEKFKANKQLEEYLFKYYKRKVQIISGFKSNEKKIRIN